ncbi:hypothetical protein [Thermococcus gammatolerans]|uniref:Uncharacterized protein n=1 Tax=Thermococcus gammatolerans (strain DSM 15229 / JCM 11827 / EJ3) TaxID=593117 RepID=C5A1M7_THEGJ|nr:hypothetical protein [Thermococcus gammatolerans]ACS34296.1 Hypothetical protein TGAM_1794 [Thermococcus gammatolerans EJ3]
MRRALLALLLSAVVLLSGCISSGSGNEGKSATSSTPTVEEKLLQGIDNMTEYNLSMVEGVNFNLSDISMLPTDLKMGFRISGLVDGNKGVILANVSLEPLDPFGMTGQSYILYVNGSNARLKPVNPNAFQGLGELVTPDPMVFRGYIGQAKHILKLMLSSKNVSITKDGSVYVVRGSLSNGTIENLPNTKFSVSSTGSIPKMTVRKAYFEATIDEKFERINYTVHVEYGSSTGKAVYELHVELRKLPEGFKITVPEKIRKG